MSDHTHDRLDLSDVADEDHRHYDMERHIERLREDLDRLLPVIEELTRRVRTLES